MDDEIATVAISAEPAFSTKAAPPPKPFFDRGETICAGLVESFRAAATAVPWVVATPLTAAISQQQKLSGARWSTQLSLAISAAKGVPASVFIKGILPATAYSAIGVLPASAVQNAIASRGDDVSRKILAPFAAATTEAAFGNPFDLKLLQDYMRLVAQRAALARDAFLIRSFTLEELKVLMPKDYLEVTKASRGALALKQLQERALQSGFANVDLSSTANARLFAKKTGVDFDMKRASGALLAMAPPSIVRNMALYGLVEIMNSSQQDGEGTNFRRLFLGGATASAISVLPNAATYAAATKYVESPEQGILRATKRAIADSASYVMRDPSKLAILLTMRFLATSATALALTERTTKAFEQAADGAFKLMVKAAFGVEPSPAEIKQVDKKLQAEELKPKSQLGKPPSSSSACR